MNNFEFYNPTKIIFGKESISKLESNIPKDSKVLMLYGGGSIKNNGVYDQVKSSLQDHIVFEFGGIEANPQYDTLMKAVEIIKKENIDYLLAVGGGSVIDGTKFVSVAAKFDGTPWSILAERKSYSEAIPFGTVLTLPATGSEMNCFAVVSKGEEKLGFGGSPLLYPQFSVLDPTVTYTLSQKQLGNGLVDAFVHVIEQYLTDKENAPIQDRFSEGILLTLIEESEKVMELKDDYQSRANLMFSATMALNGLIGSGITHDWATHMIGHELTALHGLDHARSLAVILPALLRVQKDSKKKKLDQYARRVWGLTSGTPESRIENAICLTEDFFNKNGLPTKLKAYNIQTEDFSKITKAVRTHLPFNLGENGDIDEEKIITILTKAL